MTTGDLPVVILASLSFVSSVPLSAPVGSYPAGFVNSTTYFKPGFRLLKTYFPVASVTTVATGFPLASFA